MITKLALKQSSDWLKPGSTNDSRLLHSDKSDKPNGMASLRILTCPSYLGQGYVQEIILGDDLSLVVSNYRLNRDLIVDVPSHDSSLRFSFPLTDLDAKYSSLIVCFGLREIHIERSHQPIFDVEIVFKQSTLMTYIREFLARLSPQLHYAAEQVTKSIYKYRKGYSTIDTKEMLNEIFQNSISVDSQATLEQILDGNVYSQTQDLCHASRNLISATMKRVIGQILSCPYQSLTRRAYLKQKALMLITLYFEEAMLQSHLNKSDLDCIQQAGKILKSQSINPPTTEMLAKQVGTNRFKLNQGFHQLHNTTPFGYLRDYRLQQAKRLLMTSELSVEEVATKVGYKNRSNFAIAFRQQFGINPKIFQMQVEHSAC